MIGSDTFVFFLDTLEMILTPNLKFRKQKLLS